MIDITMPRLSDTMEEGAIATWHKKEGDAVEVGDVLVEIETDKATMEYEAYEAGTLATILVQEGDLVSIGTPIARLDDGSGTAAPSESGAGAKDAAKAAPQDAPKDAAKDDAPAKTEAPATSDEPAADGERRIASPLVRRLARENDLDLSAVAGSGPGGRIVRADIEGLLASGAPKTAVGDAKGASTTTAAGDGDKRDSEKVKLSQVRRVIARRLGESKRTIPHFTVTARADAEAFMALRVQLNEQLVAAGRPKVSVNDLLTKAVSLALRAHPEVNASYVGDDADHTLLHHRVNIGIAVASDNGLVVPVVEDVDRLSLTQLGAEAKRLVGLAGDKKLSVDQMSGGTFTISNLGMFGVEEFTAIINPPEAAILAVGGTAKEAVVVDGEIVPHYVMRYTLCADHRIVDGALAAQFLKTLTGLVENPWTILV